MSHGANQQHQPHRATQSKAPAAAGVMLTSALFACGIAMAMIGCDDPWQQTTQTPTPVSQEEIDRRLAGLQEEFQKVLQEKLDLERFEARAQVFAEEFPEEPAGHVLVAQTRMSLRRWQGAYDAWLTARDLRADAFEYEKMAGFCAARLGRYEKAESHYRAAVQTMGERADSEVYASLGRLYLALDQPAKAESAFSSALVAPGPGDETNWKHEAYSGLANVSVLRDDCDGALETIDRAIRLAAVDSQADVVGYHIQKARIMMDCGSDADAVTMLTHTWQTLPDSQWRLESARLRAKLYERAGELGKAVNHVTLVCDWHQNAPERRDRVVADYVALLAEWQLKAGQADAARTTLFNLETLEPEHPRLNELKMKLN